jgi:hypothetical protein
MNFEALKTGVKRRLQDTTYDDFVGDWLNDVVEELVDEKRPPGFLGVVSVQTVLSQAYLNLPTATCSQVITLQVDSQEYHLMSFVDMFDIYPELDEVGSIEAFAVDGNVLYYQGIPSEVTDVTILCRRPVNKMVSAGDTPDGIPTYLHEKLLVSGAVLKGFDEIEDGGDVDEVMRLKMETRFVEGEAIFERWIARRTGHTSRRDNRWEV